MGRHRLFVVGLLLGIQILGLSHHAWANFDQVPVPEPSALSFLVGSGLAWFGVNAWRRRK
jgi:hypothetical protein